MEEALPESVALPESMEEVLPESVALPKSTEEVLPEPESVALSLVNPALLQLGAPGEPPPITWPSGESDWQRAYQSDEVREPRRGAITRCKQLWSLAKI